MRTALQCVFVVLLPWQVAIAAPPEKWSEQKAKEWYQQQPWLIGSNYNPASAINQLEMWQAESFDPKRIDLELGWAESVGMNTMRVYLHDLLWQQDAEGFKRRLDTFLTIAGKHKIRPVFVLFDSVWDPNPQLGKQRPPRPGVHNSGWVQSPSTQALRDPAEHRRLEAYVKGVVGAFARDHRVLAWDIWNEPDNENGSSYGRVEPKNKVELVLALLPKAFAWAREAGAQQPLTSAVWKGDWSSPEKMTPMDRLQIDLSDVVTFHNYDSPTELEKRINWLKRYNRPIICTEYMARGNGSFFIGSLPVAKAHGVGMINWGLVQGKSQTHLPWDSWERPYIDREPSIWFHEVFRTDGTPYIAEEVQFIKRMTGKVKARTVGAGLH
ncbi:MAG TPA: cellulase family glycosylhydrolase [Vicinamibacterales bacterium]|nr:cellulase family glycosylhydrolase [Vicinamibacterales bacterium]